MASRRKGRILAFQALYAWDISGTLPSGSLSMGNLSSDKSPEDPFPDFTLLLITGALENIKAIDTMIKKHLENWDFSRLNKVDLAILRMSTYALMYQSETAPSIVIDEAISISRDYGTDDSYRFINGVLDAIRKTIEQGKEKND